MLDIAASGARGVAMSETGSAEQEGSTKGSVEMLLLLMKTL